MRLLKELKKKPFANDLHYLLVTSLLFMLSIKYYLFVAILILYLIFLFIKKKMIISSLIIILLIIIRLIPFKIDNNLIEGNYNIKIIDVDNNNYVGYINNNKVIIQEYNHNYKPGDIVNLDIKINDISKSYELDFDYQEYLYSKNIKYSLKGSNSKLIKNGFSIYSIRYNYLKYLNHNLSSDSFDYVKALVFGDNDLDIDIKDSYSILGISHILAISGLHILLLFKILSLLLYKLFHYYHDLIPISIISIFVILIGFPSSCLRALLFLIIGSLNKYGKRRYTKLDILSISFIIMLIYSPYLCYQSGFLLSFLVSFILIFSNEVIGKNKYKLIKLYKTYLLIFFITLPIVVNFNNNISVISILLSPILSNLLAYIIVPIAYILSIFPIFDFIFKYLFRFLNIYILNLSDLLPLIKIQSFNIYMILAYYLLFSYVIYTLIRKEKIIKSVSYLLSYLVLVLSIYYINPVASITFIDCGQGDSSLIRLPYDRGIMVIDCYNSLDYLKTTGIKKIDYLVLTHSDNDHIGDYKKIIKEYKINYLIYPIYDIRFDELLDGINVKSIGINDTYRFKDNSFKIDILGPINSYDEINSNSVVLKIKIYNTTFLYTGDMTLEEENDLVLKYKDNLKSDILKVGHHGSNTSTGDEFLKLVNPDISIVSVGLNNKYNLPNDDVIKKLNKTSKVYETRYRGNINIFIFKNKKYVNTYK